MSRWDERKRDRADGDPVHLLESPFSYSFFFPSDFGAFHRALLDPTHRAPRAVELADIARFCEDFVLLDFVGLTSRALDYIAPHLVEFYDDTEDLPLVNIENDVATALKTAVHRIDAGLRTLTPARRIDGALRAIVLASIERQLNCFSYSGPSADVPSDARRTALAALRRAFRDDIAEMEVRLESERRKLEMDSAAVAEETRRAIAMVRTEDDLAPYLTSERLREAPLIERRSDNAACQFLLRNFYEIEPNERDALSEAVSTLKQLELTDKWEELEHALRQLPRPPTHAEALATASREAGLSVSPSAAAAAVFSQESQTGQEARLLYESVAEAAQNDAELLSRWGRRELFCVPPVLQLLLHRSASKSRLLQSLVELRDEFGSVRQELYELRVEVQQAATRVAKLRAIKAAESARDTLMRQFGGTAGRSLAKRVWSLATVDSISGVLGAAADLAFDMGKGNVLVSSVRHFLDLYQLTREIDHSDVSRIFGEIVNG